MPGLFKRGVEWIRQGSPHYQESQTLQALEKQIVVSSEAISGAEKRLTMVIENRTGRDLRADASASGGDEPMLRATIEQGKEQLAKDEAEAKRLREVIGQ